MKWVKMKIRVYGKNKKLTTEEVKYALKWMSKLVLSWQLDRNLDIKVKFRSKEGFKGFTEGYEEDYKLRKFDIVICPKMSKKNQLLTIAHELVHVKQLAKKELGHYTIGPLTKWKNDYVNHYEVDYWDQPWEIEAFGREIGIYNRYIQHINDDNIKFQKRKK
jgi:hypothetical protein